MLPTLKMTKTLKYLLFIITACILFLAIYYPLHRHRNPMFSSVIFQTDSGWAYKIILNHKVIIQQTFIPAVQGNHPFQTAEDAKRTSQLVIEKLEHRQLPSVTVEELNLLKVKY